MTRVLAKGRQQNQKSRRQRGRVLGSALLACALAGSAQVMATDQRAPEVPAALKVPAGNVVHFRVHAEGYQVYKWMVVNEEAMWVFQRPDAVLFQGQKGVVGMHYGGPTWESISGSKVVGMRLAGATVDPKSVAWLLLQATSVSGPGILARTTFIQRVNTVGGLAPSSPGTVEGEEAEVPYTADYVFYRSAD
jgi:hypothetical protein